MRATAPQVWRAISDPKALDEWFGTLASPLANDQFVSIKLLDGDLFLAQLVEADEPAGMQYVWASLGVGVENTITWRITPREGACLVRVTDEEPERTAAQAERDELRWRHVLSRLEKYLRGDPIDPECSDRFDAGVEFVATVEGACALLLESTKQGSWLPLEGPSLSDCVTLRIDDESDPSSFIVRDVHADVGGRRLTFHVDHADWLRATRVELAVGPRVNGTMLTVQHDGWRGISSKRSEQRRQRARWCAAWARIVRRFTLLYVRSREVPTIDADKLCTSLDNPALYIFDTNLRTRWDRGHLRGATYVGPGPFTADVLPEDTSASLVFYCLSPF